jgi:hypothetical protein
MVDAALRQLVAEAVAPLTAEVRALRQALELRETEAPWLTRQELAEQLACHPDTVDRRAAAGDGIELRKIGRAVRVRLVPRATEAAVAAAAAKALG